MKVQEGKVENLTASSPQTGPYSKGHISATNNHSHQTSIGL